MVGMTYIRDARLPARPASPSALLDVKDLHVAFGNQTGMSEVVCGLSFHVNAGEVVGLVGESGSGKTIACKAILDLLPNGAFVSGGEIVLQGRDITQLPAAARAAVRGREVGLIPQDPLSALNPVLKIGSQITETIRLHRRVGRKEADELALELLDAVQIRNATLVMRQYPHELSGGMRQRIVSVIALSAQPKLIIADEPTTSLDVTIQQRFIETLRSLQAKLGFGMIFVTHDLALISSLADRICVMRKGAVVDAGSARQVFTRPTSDYTKALLRAVPRIDLPENRPGRDVNG